MQALKVIEIQCCILLMALLHFCFIIIKQWFSYSVHWLFDQIFFFPFSNKFEDDTCRVYFHNHFISSFSSFSFFALLSYSLSLSLSLSFVLSAFLHISLSILLGRPIEQHSKYNYIGSIHLQNNQNKVTAVQCILFWVAFKSKSFVQITAWDQL